MTGQTDKKRNIVIDGITYRLQSRRITINSNPAVTAGKVKFKDVWYIFDLETGKVIYQGNTWTDCLNGVKDIITKHING